MAQPRSTPAVGLSVMPEPEYLTATLPLFEAGVVDTIEWSFDMSWRAGVPAWLAGLLHDYDAAGQLSGHGVSLSPLSRHPRQERWFNRFERDAANHQFTHVSEHFGFMAAGDFRLGPPLPLPMTNETLQIGRQHLTRLAAVTGGQVGLENLAFAFSTADVWTQGDFLEELLEPVDGFLVLDVHNLWCQIVNFGLDPAELLATYPVDRVSECHVSGGSWSEVSDQTPDGRAVRRDTHDGAVPDEVFALLETVLRACPNAETVILERIGSTLGSPEADAGFRDDYQRVRDVCAAASEVEPPPPPRLLANEAVDASTYPAELMHILDTSDSSTYPAELMHILDTSDSYDQAATELKNLKGDVWGAWVEAMDPAMVATARELVATWGRRSTSDVGGYANGDS